MKQDQKTLIISSFALLALIALMVKPSAKTEMASMTSNEVSQKSLPISQAKVSATNLVSQVPAALSPKSEAELYYKKFFAGHLLKNSMVAAIYNHLQEDLRSTASKELIAMFIARAAVMENSQDFYQFMMSLQAQINAHAEEIAQDLADQTNILQKDPFIYQMSLNLANHLPVSADEKMPVLGQALQLNFDFDDNGNMSPMAGNITVALILMKTSGVSDEAALPYIQKGIAANQNDAKALAEYLARVKAYYPNLVALSGG